MSARLRWLLGGAGAIGVMVLAVGTTATIAIRQAATLGAMLVNCEEVHASGLCEVGDDLSLRIRVEAGGDDRLSVLDGGWPIRVARDRFVDGGRLITVRVRAGGPRTLRVLSRRGRRLAQATFPVASRKEPQWIAQVRGALLRSDQQGAQSLLDRYLPSVTDVESRARATSLLARLQWVRGQHTEALATLERAIALHREAGLLSGVLNDTTWVTRILGEERHQFAAAAARLHAEDAWFALAPDLRLWEQLQLSEHQKQRGDLSGALALLDEAIAGARRFGDDSALYECRIARAEVLLLLGRIRDSLSEFDTLPHELVSPCHQAFGRLSLGEARLKAMEASTAVQAGVDSARWAPAPPLREAADIFGGPTCRQLPPRIQALTALARAAALSGDTGLARQLLAEARALPGDKDEDVPVEWADLEAQIELREGHHEVAAARFRALAALAAGMKSLTTSYEIRWRSAIGLAQALESTDPEGAARAFADAEAWLDERGRTLSVGNGGGFLGRHERGTALYLDFLVRRGGDDVVLALAVARHARTRALLALSAIAQSATLGDADRQKCDTALKEYRDLRLHLADEPISQSAIDRSSQSDEKLRERPLQRARQVQQLMDVVEKSLKLDDGSLSATLAPPPPGPDEALLVFHPAKSGWLCLLGRGDRAAAIRIPNPSQEAVAAAFLGASGDFAELKKGVRRMRVIAYGATRLVDVEAIVRDDAVRVTYAFDLPGRAPPPPPQLATTERPKALLVLDPAGGLERAQSILEPLPRLLESSWRMELVRRPPVIIGDYRGRIPSPRLRLDPVTLAGLLDGVQLLVFYGHGPDNTPRGIWDSALVLGADGALMVGDVLMLRSVPRFVVLVACNAGVAPSEVGGLEGLGLAQAFLARGSQWVIAPVDYVDPVVAAELTVALFEAGLERPGADPVAALRAARDRVRKRLPAGASRDRSLGAFRVFER